MFWFQEVSSKYAGEVNPNTLLGPVLALQSVALISIHQGPKNADE